MHDLTFGILHWTLAATGVWLITGTLLNFSSHPHWYIRRWDFPRVLTAALAAIVAAAWAWTCDWRWWDAVFLASLAGVVGIQVWNIYPYTALARQQVLRAERTGHAATSIRLVATNVLMENRAFEKWSEVVRAADPDIILAVEIDDVWMERAVRPLVADWPHVVAEPRDNHYGMVLLSRLELVNPEVRHQVQADVPSIHCGVRLKSGLAVAKANAAAPNRNRETALIASLPFATDPVDQPVHSTSKGNIGANTMWPLTQFDRQVRDPELRDSQRVRSNVTRTYPDPHSSNEAGRTFSRSGALSQMISLLRSSA